MPYIFVNTKVFQNSIYSSLDNSYDQLYGKFHVAGSFRFFGGTKVCENDGIFLHWGLIVLIEISVIFTA